MRKNLVLITSGAASVPPTVLELVQGMKGQAELVDLCLLQDGVLCLLRGNETAAGKAIGRALEQGIGLYYLADDLIARGFRQDDVRAGAHPLSYGYLVELILADERAVLGAF